MAAKSPEVRHIAVSEIRENPVALRAVNRESEEYVGLRDAIASVGVLNPIVVRQQKEEIDGKITKYFELIDGLQRYTCSLDVGLKEIPAQIIDLDDARTLEAQIMANVHKVETRAVQYAKQLQRIFAANPTLTLAEMAAKVAKSPAWISKLLGLLKLEKTIQAMVDDGKITVSNACELAKLPPEYQLDYVDQAITMNSEEFVPLVQSRAKEIRDAARQGRAPKQQEFVATPRLQKLSILKAEFENPTIGPELCQRYNVVAGPAGFTLGVAWALNLDPASVEVRKAAAEEKKAALEEEKKQRKAERTKKKAEEAAKLAAQAAEEANLSI